MNVKHYLSSIPKAELHVHLEGSIQPATLLLLAQRNGIDLPTRTLEDLQHWFSYRDFNHFAQIFAASARCLKTAADYELIAYEFGANMAKQHVRYAEVTFSPCMHHFTLGNPHDTYFTGLQCGRQRAKADFGVEIRWIFDIVRDIADTSYRQLRADYTTSVAIEGLHDGVVALGMGGAEAGNPPAQFVPWFARARAAGLHNAPHAGETAGPTSVWEALHTLDAERIGHGVRSSEDPTLVAYLASHRIPIEVCPTNNICIGMYPDMSAHPLPRLYVAGVPVTINSDDPSLFNTTLNDEVTLLADPFNLDLAAIDDIVLNGVRHSFLPAEAKQTMEKSFQVEMSLLKQM